MGRDAVRSGWRRGLRRSYQECGVYAGHVFVLQRKSGDDKNSMQRDRCRQQVVSRAATKRVGAGVTSRFKTPALQRREISVQTDLSENACTS